MLLVYLYCLGALSTMDAVSATIFDGGRAISRKQDEL
jgi:hypothetical protein